MLSAEPITNHKGDANELEANIELAEEVGLDVRAVFCDRLAGEKEESKALKKSAVPSVMLNSKDKTAKKSKLAIDDMKIKEAQQGIKKSLEDMSNNLVRNGESNEANNSLRMSLRERPRKLHAERKLRERCDELKFLDDFDPEKSNREKRKLKRKGSQQNSRSLYDEYGRIRHNGLDVCDCMNEDCPGCWFECENCGSTKCGLQCRVNRKFFYESIAFDGKDAIIKNKHFPTPLMGKVTQRRLLEMKSAIVRGLEPKRVTCHKKGDEKEHFWEPRSRHSKFIGGIGIPTDLTYESLTIGYVLKAEFWLPWNSTVFYENPYLPQYKKISYSQRHFKRDIDHKTTLRWNIYQKLIETLNSYGYKGQECILKAICEANAVAFRRDYSMFDELMHIFFSPSRSRDLKSEDSQHFLEAAKLGGESGETSCELYECSLSLLALISTIF
ncbi:hypothetical protein GQX74_010611 [Glossina fuscipes]|nr:hypothetical protein GQX74_010611 [Glossina fuscipes]